MLSIVFVLRFCGEKRGHAFFRLLFCFFLLCVCVCVSTCWVFCDSLLRASRCVFPCVAVRTLFLVLFFVFVCLEKALIRDVVK